MAVTPDRFDSASASHMTFTDSWHMRLWRRFQSVFFD